MADQSTEMIRCDLCGEDAPIPVHRENDWQICRCSHCDLVYVNPRPKLDLGEDVEHFEAEGADDNQTDGALVYGNGLELIGKFSSEKGKLLDVGCGFGFFLKEARNHGWSTYGIDVSNVAVDYAKSTLGLENVVRGDFLQSTFAEGEFQAVTLWNALEHLPSPQAFLAEAHRVLEDDGVILIRVPNLGFVKLVWWIRPLVELAGYHNFSYLLTPPPHHLFGFTPKTLRAYLERSGYEVVHLAPATVKTSTYDRMGWKQAIGARVVAIASRLAFVLSLGHWNICPTMCAVARKKA